MCCCAMNNEPGGLTGWPESRLFALENLESGHPVSPPSSLFIAQQHIYQLTSKTVHRSFGQLLHGVETSYSLSVSPLRRRGRRRAMHVSCKDGVGRQRRGHGRAVALS